MNHMADDETNAMKKKSSTSGVLAKLPEDALSDNDGSVEKVDPKKQGTQKDEQKSYLGHVLLQGFLKNNNNSVQVKKRAEAKLGLKALKDEYRKRKAIEACITCTLTNFKSQIQRLESGIKFAVKLAYKDRLFVGRFYKRKSDNHNFKSNVKLQNRNDRMVGDSPIDFFNPDERAEHKEELEQVLNIKLQKPNLKMMLKGRAIKAYKIVYKTSKQAYMESENNEILKRLGSGVE
jgi:hypothetical protein